MYQGTSTGISSQRLLLSCGMSAGMYGMRECLPSPMNQHCTAIKQLHTLASFTLLVETRHQCPWCLTCCCMFRVTASGMALDQFVIMVNSALMRACCTLGRALCSRPQAYAASKFRLATSDDGAWCFVTVHVTYHGSCMTALLVSSKVTVDAYCI